jgi:type VI protein secretion system component Hcp
MHSTICRKILLSAAGVLLFASGLAFTSRPVSAAMDTYLVLVQTRYGQIKGDSTFPGHEGWMEAEKASLGNLDLREENHDALQKVISEAGPGKATINSTISSLTITKSVDSASPHLLEAAKHGGRVETIVVECVSGNHITHTLTITGGTLSVKPAGPGKEAIIVVGGHVAYS